MAHRQSILVLTSSLVVALGLVGCKGMPRLTWKSDEFPAVLPGSKGQIAESAPPKIEEAKEEPPSPKMLIDFAYVQMSVAHYMEAADLFERAVRLDPKSTAGYVGLAKAKVAMGHPDQAIALMKEGLKKNPKSAALWNEIAIAEATRKRFPDAVQALEKARKLDPDTNLYATNLASIHAVSGNLDQAYKLYASVMSEADSRFEMARILGAQGKTGDCQKQLELAVEAEPTHIAAQQMLQSLRLPPDLQKVGFQRPDNS